MGLRIIALAFILLSIFVVITALLPEDSQTSLKQVFLSKEQKSLFNECEQARQSLQKQGLPGKVAQVDFMIRDTRLEKDPVLQDLKKCFTDSKAKNKNFRLEIELFSSDYGNETSADLQVQASLFDTKSSNKVAEVGFRLDHAPVTEKNQPEPQKN